MIATYLMSPWKQGQFASNGTACADNSRTTINLDENGSDSEMMPWHSWPRPPGGFLDLGYAHNSNFSNEKKNSGDEEVD